MAVGETDDPNAIIESYKAEAPIAKGDPVYLSSDGKVSAAAAAQDCIGVAVKAAPAEAPCPVLVRGRVKVKAGGVIHRGKAVYGADATKRILELSDQAIDEAGSATYTITYNQKLATALQTTAEADDLLFIQL
jgi:hypothetical protein